MISLTRGTTPTVTCNLPDDMDLSDVSEVWFSIRQQSNGFVHKLSEDKVDVIGNSLVTVLTQEETLGFSSHRPAECGIRIRMGDGSAWSLAQPEPVKVLPIVEEGEI